jgi:hypothetical protein
MAKPFTEWTVLPHEPVEKLAENLWRVSGMLGNIQRQMVLAKRRDGQVVVYNPIALDESEMKELEAWGRPTILVVPNGYHRQDSLIWKKRYPDAKVVAPPRGVKRISKVVPVDATTDAAPSDEDVRFLKMEGADADALLEVRSDGEVSLVFCDTILNLPRQGGPMGFLLGPTGRASTPRIQRWIAIQDRRALSAYLDRLADTPGLTRLLVGHGEPVTDDAPGALRRVAQQLAE